MFLINSAFICDPHGHGGNKRSAQIVSTLRNHGVTYHNLQDQPLFKGGRLYAFYMAALPLIRQLKVPLTNKSYISFIGSDTFRFQNFFEENAPGVFLWEYAANQHYHLPLLAKKAGWKVVALPHNLESMVPDQSSRISGRRSPFWFDEELKVLSYCDHVVTISREEQWLLRLHGINADFLPYYPTKETEAAYLSVRQYRQRNFLPKTIKKFLILGTLTNSPTRQGMIELIRAFTKRASHDDDSYELHIAGYGTENLMQYIDLPQKIQLHGGIDQKKLEILLLDIDGMITHQPATTGCLTKLPEMLIAGVPMLLNSNAARSWHGWFGVYIYETFEELFELMARNLEAPLCPERPIEHELRFIENNSSESKE
jgi:hypothetical protein